MKEIIKNLKNKYHQVSVDISAYIASLEQLNLVIDVDEKNKKLLEQQLANDIEPLLELAQKASEEDSAQIKKDIELLTRVNVQLYHFLINLRKTTSGISNASNDDNNDNTAIIKAAIDYTAIIKKAIEDIEDKENNDKRINTLTNELTTRNEANQKHYGEIESGLNRTILLISMLVMVAACALTIAATLLAAPVAMVMIPTVIMLLSGAPIMWMNDNKPSYGKDSFRLFAKEYNHPTIQADLHTEDFVKKYNSSKK